MSTAKQTAEDLIASHKIAFFAKTYCPYCQKVRDVIAKLNLGQHVGIIELDEAPEGAAIQEYLAEKTGQKTVPNLFIDGKHIGGSTDFLALESSGELQKLVSA
ncbi:Glutaredoxin [Tilletia horrida]|nr:Glutaredoxin [Tilletia horrida]KAK0533391.1 Glutaredoxin [Tilletia horrida]KAK0559267.1 Glutaredoxin [Tilletia horrida]